LSHDAAVTAIMRVEVGGAQYITGGFDGKLKLWTSAFEAEGEVSLCTNETVLAEAAMGQDMKGVRGGVKGMDCVGGRAVVGTKDNEVYVVDMGSKEVKCATLGHSGELWGLVTHPSQAVCVTAGDDKLLRCWDLTGKSGVTGKALGLPYMGRSLEPWVSVPQCGLWSLSR
jgi:WD40 repeat protein